MKFKTNSPAINLLNIKNLSQHFQNVNAGKLEKLILLCSCVYLSRSANLYKCADEVGHLLDSDLKEDSYYQLLLRFFQTGKGEAILQGIFSIIIYLLWLHGEAILLLDRTNWQYGKYKIINLLVIGVVYKGVLIPLVWQDLNKAGNSNSQERLDLVDKCLIWWQATGLEVPTLYIVGDREFIGRTWLLGLQKRGLKYVMRLKGNRKFEFWQHYNGNKRRKVRLSVIRRWLDRYQQDYAEVVIGDELIANVMILPLESGGKVQKGRYLYMITNINNKLKASELYAIRWKIEVCFKHLKTNGFNLEAINLTQTHKVELMFGVLTLTYVLAVREGVLVYEAMGGEIPMKTYKNGQKRLKKSVFRKGLNAIKKKVFDLNSMIVYINSILIEIKAKLLKNNIKYISLNH